MAGGPFRWSLAAPGLTAACTPGRPRPADDFSPEADDFSPGAGFQRFPAAIGEADGALDASRPSPCGVGGSGRNFGVGGLVGAV